MAEKSSPLRTRQEIADEYFQHAAQASFKQHKMKKLQSEVDCHWARMEELDQETPAEAVQAQPQAPSSQEQVTSS